MHYNCEIRVFSQDYNHIIKIYNRCIPTDFLARIALGAFILFGSEARKKNYSYFGNKCIVATCYTCDNGGIWGPCSLDTLCSTVDTGCPVDSPVSRQIETNTVSQTSGVTSSL